MSPKKVISSTTTASRAGRDAAFARPQDLPDEWYGIWESLVTDMRKESQALPMNTMMALLVERIATTYVQVRMLEGGEKGADLEYLREIQALWLKFVKEFAVQLHRNSQTPEARFVASFKAAVNTAVRKAGPDSTVRDLLPILAEELSAYDI
jgi:hypothetical protein